jgi:hypothetical protein
LRAIIGHENEYPVHFVRYRLSVFGMSFCMPRLPELLMQSAKRAAVFDEREWRPVRPSIVRDGPSDAEWRHMIAIVMW